MTKRHSCKNFGCSFLSSLSLQNEISPVGKMREALTKRNIHLRTSLSIEKTYHPPDDQVEKKHRVDRQGSPEVINFRILSLIPLGSLWITLQGLYSLLRIAWMRKLTSRNLDDSIWKTKGQAFNQLD